MSKKDHLIEPSDTLLIELRGLITDARQQVAQAVNATLTMLYWQIGKRIHQEVLREKRADYGKQIVASVGRQLAAEFGPDFGEKNLRRMIQFAGTFPDEEIVAALRRQLGWTHFKSLIPLKNDLARNFYAEMCRVEQWSTRTLANKIDPLLGIRFVASEYPTGKTHAGRHRHPRNRQSPNP
ncbi:DUF1016 N-terminal domain-containing protein [Pelagicoccus sp. SDUM812005]|uniref:DUF1016 N-terminal domain-containing protein n=1 Tax=Pelagicoccus sp. SDUM812005 TaxID=3041257 RepID=UPI00280DECE3|nr:DUF1016 N-terminal domain-containing protein [Pelagicoccus sp. SDUM812005]MDQ8183838.1 DUF1016 N-terminal domain-containing protein [Pelagicoccus sp. SDUM812005]